MMASAIASPLAVVFAFADDNQLVAPAAVAYGCRSVLPITRRDSLAVEAA